MRTLLKVCLILGVRVRVKINHMKPYIFLCKKPSPGYVCNHGSLRERDAASPRFGNALCVTGSESAV